MKIKLLLYYLLVLGVTIVVMACSIKEPQMPKWNTSLNLPLGEYKFTAMDLVKDSTIFDIREADSLIMIDISGDIEKQIIDTTELSIEGVDTVTSVSIDTVYIDSLDLLRVPDSVLTMGKIAPDLYDLIGSSILIGSTSPVIEPVSLASGDFDSVHVTSGYVKLNINNNLPVAIASGSVLRIYSHPHADGDDSLLAAITIDNDILPGNSLPPKTVPLVYDWLISPVCIHFELETRASDGEVEITQDLLDNQGIGISLTFKDIKADQATSRLSAHDYTWEGAVEIEEDSVKLYAGKIHKGLIHFDIMNDLPVSGDVRIEILNFRKEDMSIVYEEFILLSEQNNPKDITLDDIYIVYIDEDGSPVVDSDVPLDSIHYKIYLHQEKYDDPITLMAGDSMGVTISMDSLKFQWLKAELVERTEIEIEPTETTGISDYEGFDGEIEFNDLALQINIFNEFELGNVDFTLNLWGYREEDGVVVEDMQITPLITDSIRPGENLFSITDADTDGKISQLVNMMPT
ncbi:MAG: hypothetical protein KAR38_14035, partial [Calditrichia bacterium]|nr:hypothetical protein [Calditrichia bacterium]